MSLCFLYWKRVFFYLKSDRKKSHLPQTVPPLLFRRPFNSPHFFFIPFFILIFCPHYRLQMSRISATSSGIHAGGSLSRLNCLQSIISGLDAPLSTCEIRNSDKTVVSARDFRYYLLPTLILRMHSIGQENRDNISRRSQSKEFILITLQSSFLFQIKNSQQYSTF